MIGTIVAAALWAFAASLILSLVIGAAVGIAIHFVQPAASTRQALWSVASGAAGFAPVIILAGMLVRGAFAPSAALPVTTPQHRAAATQHAATQKDSAPISVSPDAVPAGSAPMVSVRLTMPDPPHIAPAVARIIVALWLLGAIGGLIGLGRSIVRVRGLKLRSSPLDGELATELPWLTTTQGREIYLRLSYETETPIAIGFRRPVILIPTEMATASGLTSIEPLVMHEYAHLARRDDWTNLVQRVIERVFWFNPFVWIIGRRIVLEREVAADEAVVERTHDAKNYASALWRMAQEMRMPEHVVVAPGAMLTRKQISVRIERLLEETPFAGKRFGAAALAVALIAFTGAAAVAATAPPVPLTPVTTLALVEPVALDSIAAPAAPKAPALPVDAEALRKKAKRLADDMLRNVSEGQRKTAQALQHAADQKAQVATSTGTLTREFVAGCEGCSFTHRDLHNVDLSNLDLAGDDFSYARLDGANFSATKMQGVDFSHAQLTHAQFRNAKLTGVDFTRANLAGADLSGASLTGVDLTHATLDGTVTTGMHMIGSSL